MLFVVKSDQSDVYMCAFALYPTRQIACSAVKGDNSVVHRSVLNLEPNARQAVALGSQCLCSSGLVIIEMGAVLKLYMVPDSVVLSQSREPQSRDEAREERKEDGGAARTAVARSSNQLLGRPVEGR